MSTWVLLRGLARETRHWGEFPARLSARLAGARLVAVDLPGNGALHRQKSPLRVAQMAASARAQLAARGVGGPYHLLAMSLGAMVAIDWASRYPDEIAGAVLINTSLRGVSPPHHRLRPAAGARLLRLAFAAGDADRERTILALTSRQARNAPAAAALVERWTALRRQAPVSPRNALRQLLAAACYRPPATGPSVPLLLLSSLGDALVDPRCSQRLAERWGVAHAVHPYAGHDLPLDDGAWVAQRIARWLDAAGQAAGPPHDDAFSSMNAVKCSASTAGR